MAQESVFEELARYHEARAAVYGIQKLGIFGSIARGTGGPQGDIDIVVELTKPDLLILVGIKQELEDLLDRPVDVVRYRDNMNGFLKRRIDREVVYV